MSDSTIHGLSGSKFSCGAEKELSRKSQLLEDLVKMVFLSPLLDWSGFYQQDVQIKTEEKVEYQLEDKDETIREFLDFLNRTCYGSGITRILLSE